MTGEKYIPPAKRASATQSLNKLAGDWRATRSTPELATASAVPLPISTPSSKPLKDNLPETRRWSVPEPQEISACQPAFLAGVFTREQASVFSKLWLEHRRASRWGADDLYGIVKDTEAYKRNELEFRLWLISRVDRYNWREMSCVDMQKGFDMGRLHGIKDTVIKQAIKVPDEVLALLEEVIDGRERAQDKYFYDCDAGDQQVVNHRFYAAELRRMHTDLSAPPNPRLNTEQILRQRTWRPAPA